MVGLGLKQREAKEEKPRLELPNFIVIGKQEKIERKYRAAFDEIVGNKVAEATYNNFADAAMLTLQKLDKAGTYKDVLEKFKTKFDAAPDKATFLADFVNLEGDSLEKTLALRAKVLYGPAKTEQAAPVFDKARLKQYVDAGVLEEKESKFCLTEAARKMGSFTSLSEDAQKGLEAWLAEPSGQVAEKSFGERKITDILDGVKADIANQVAATPAALATEFNVEEARAQQAELFNNDGGAYAGGMKNPAKTGYLVSAGLNQNVFGTYGKMKFFGEAGLFYYVVAEDKEDKRGIPKIVGYKLSDKAMEQLEAKFGKENVQAWANAMNEKMKSWNHDNNYGKNDFIENSNGKKYRIWDLLTEFAGKMGKEDPTGKQKKSYTSDVEMHVSVASAVAEVVMGEWEGLTSQQKALIHFATAVFGSGDRMRDYVDNYLTDESKGATWRERMNQFLIDKGEKRESYRNYTLNNAEIFLTAVVGSSAEEAPKPEVVEDKKLGYYNMMVNAKVLDGEGKLTQQAFDALPSEMRESIKGFVEAANLKEDPDRVLSPAGKEGVPLIRYLLFAKDQMAVAETKRKAEAESAAKAAELARLSDPLKFIKSIGTQENGFVVDGKKKGLLGIEVANSEKFEAYLKKIGYEEGEVKRTAKKLGKFKNEKDLVHEELVQEFIGRAYVNAIEGVWSATEEQPSAKNNLGFKLEVPEEYGKYKPRIAQQLWNAKNGDSGTNGAVATLFESRMVDKKETVAQVIAKMMVEGKPIVPQAELKGEDYNAAMAPYLGIVVTAKGDGFELTEKALKTITYETIGDVRRKELVAWLAKPVGQFKDAKADEIEVRNILDGIKSEFEEKKKSTPTKEQMFDHKSLEGFVGSVLAESNGKYEFTDKAKKTQTYIDVMKEKTGGEMVKWLEKPTGKLESATVNNVGILNILTFIQKEVVTEADLGKPKEAEQGSVEAYVQVLSKAGLLEDGKKSLTDKAKEGLAGLGYKGKIRIEVDGAPATVSKLGQAIKQLETALKEGTLDAPVPDYASDETLSARLVLDALLKKAGVEMAALVVNAERVGAPAGQTPIPTGIGISAPAEKIKEDRWIEAYRVAGVIGDSNAGYFLTPAGAGIVGKNADGINEKMKDWKYRNGIDADEAGGRRVKDFLHVAGIMLDERFLDSLVKIGLLEKANDKYSLAAGITKDALNKIDIGDLVVKGKAENLIGEKKAKIKTADYLAGDIQIKFGLPSSRHLTEEERKVLGVVANKLMIAQRPEEAVEPQIVKDIKASGYTYVPDKLLEWLKKDEQNERTARQVMSALGGDNKQWKEYVDGVTRD